MQIIDLELELEKLRQSEKGLKAEIDRILLENQINKNEIEKLIELNKKQSLYENVLK